MAECAVEDDLRPILKKVLQADAIVLGSPIYFGTVSGEMRSFMERLLFPYRPYADKRDPRQSLFSQKDPYRIYLYDECYGENR